MTGEGLEKRAHGFDETKVEFSGNYLVAEPINAAKKSLAKNVKEVKEQKEDNHLVERVTGDEAHLFTYQNK